MSAVKYQLSEIDLGRMDVTLSTMTEKTRCYCTARQCLPLRRKSLECPIINPALLLLMKHLVIGQRQKASNFSAFYWSPYGSLVSIRNHEGSTFTGKDRNKINYRSGPNHRIGSGYAGRALLQ